MSSGRLWQIVGGATVLGGGYYLYNAGGSPKAAEKRFEADLTKAGNSVGLASKGKEAQKVGEVGIADAGKKVDELVSNVKATTSNIDKKLEGYRAEAEKTLNKEISQGRVEANKAIDSFDKKVTEEAAKAKSTLGGWFGGSK
ncbi:hypothetical protein LTR56_011944 [Elasticomyces elasticus]|nr:hypothetical protein LTR56_011944 [Elasticomyces elasticus]KAK3654788.1 hypothetical protein LTR22_010554 [Elasticomyces elasticus]KAK4920600.1 hypothetical protein LTR49_011847 [Elasticomyces elasticus]KAK5714234.1 hypothetical protein LTR17_017316 [Elasticomyces elasticus]KAK5759372.1 hypothetical protein LTS12_010537 [Elasticomyces elasticus]